MVDEVVIGTNSFPVLVAISEEEQRKGLMGVSWPPPIMAFPYKKANVHKFWMKNTPSPLNILFCHAGRIIEICDGEPYSTTLIGPNTYSDLIVEMPQGSVAKHDIKINDKIRIKYSSDSLKKLFPQL